MNGNDCLLLLFYLMIAAHIAPTSCYSDVRKPSQRCRAIFVPNGKMIVKHRGKVGKFVCNTGYKLIGDKIATCHGGLWDTVPVCVKDIVCPHEMPKVLNGKMVPFNYVYFKVVCNPGFMVPREIQSIFPCERFYDPDMKPPVCQLTDEQFCDFETDTCKWNNTVPSFSWILYQNATPSHSLRTGPEGDHTYGTGHYLYIEASGIPSNEERFAKLVRRFWKVDTPEVCFVFWYHMYGFNIGTLDVYVDYVKVFTKTGNLGDKWRKGIVQHLPSDRDFYISMVATTGNGYAGDIAIDDIGLVNSTDCTKIILNETSCKDRCFEVETNSTLCKCSSECLVEANCCPDFMQTCGADGPKSTSEVSESTYETSQTVSQEVNYSETISSYQSSTDLSSELYTNTDVVDVGSTSVEQNQNPGDVSSPNPSNSVFEGTVYYVSTMTTDGVIKITESSNPIYKQAMTNNYDSPVGSTSKRTKDSESPNTPTVILTTPMLPEHRETAISKDEVSTSAVDMKSSEVESSSTSPLAPIESVTKKMDEEVSGIYEYSNHSTAKYSSTTVKSSSRAIHQKFEVPSTSSTVISKVPTILMVETSDTPTASKVNKSEVKTTLKVTTHQVPTTSKVQKSEVSTTSKVHRSEVLTTQEHVTHPTPTTSKVQKSEVSTTLKHVNPEVTTTSTSPATWPLTQQTKILKKITQQPTEPTSHPQKPETNPSSDVANTAQISNLDPTIRGSEIPSTTSWNDEDEDPNEPTEPVVFTVEVVEKSSTRTIRNNATNSLKGSYKRQKTYVPKGRYTFSAVKSESKTTTYVSLVVGILIFLSAAFFAGYVFRQRRSHLFRGSTEESDVLYMTSDEILDFNVARRPAATGTTTPSSSQQMLCQTEY